MARNVVAALLLLLGGVFAVQGMHCGTTENWLMRPTTPQIRTSCGQDYATITFKAGITLDDCEAMNVKGELMCNQTNDDCLMNACVGVIQETGDLRVDLAVYQIKQASFSYFAHTTRSSVCWNGSTTAHAKKGTTYSVNFDESVFDTSSDPSLIHFTVNDIDLSTQIDTINLTTTWEQVDFINTNLATVPTQFQYFTNLKSLNLANNNIKIFPDYASWKSLTSLNLTGNLFWTFPDSIFKLKNLKTLDLSNCKTADVHLTATQFDFLAAVDTFNADFTVTGCKPGYVARKLQGAFAVCVEVGSGNPVSGHGSSENGSVQTSTKSLLQRYWWAIVAAVVVVILVAVFGCFMCCRRRHVDSNQSTKGASTQGLTESLLTLTSTQPGPSFDIWTDPDLLEVRIDYASLNLTKVIAHGSFGEVWLAQYEGRLVVAKQMRSDKRSTHFVNAFVSEIKLCARLDHPKIVSFIGVAWRSMQTLLSVTEYMENGDLFSFLSSDRSETITWKDAKGTIALDVVEALVYLHTLNPTVIHRDLKSRNVMLDAELNAKLSDFGISKQQENDQTMTCGVGTARWMAPEVMTGGHYTEAADMYSFGVVLTELDTRRLPFHDAMNGRGTMMKDVEILQLVIRGDMHPSFSPGCPPAIQHVGLQCLSMNPAERPSAMQVSYELRQAVNTIRSFNRFDTQVMEL